MKRALCMIAIGLVTVVATAPARAQPTTQPGFEAPARSGRPRGQVSREEMIKARQFAELNLPHMYAFMEDLPPQSQRRARMANFMLERYRRSVRIRDNPEQLDAYLARLKVQDAPFEVLARLKDAPEEQKSALREELRERMRRVVQGWLDERRERIQDLERQLEREKQLLERDSQREIDRLANDHMNKLLGELRDPHLSPPELGMPGDPPPSTEPSDSPRRR